LGGHLRRHDKAVLELLIFCISKSSWLHLLKTLVHLAVEAEAKIVDLAVFYGLGLALVVIGIIIIVAAVILISKGEAKKSKVRGAGIIMIGPIPIIFGTDQKSIKNILVIALALTIMVLIITLVHYWLLR
jgi:uncharacterized protein (TIGR00304 family)